MPEDGGLVGTSTLVVPADLIPGSPQMAIFAVDDCVLPSAHGQPTQEGPNAWIMEMQDYLKDNILLDEDVDVDQIVHLAK
jgi:hypothetical protein